MKYHEWLQGYDRGKSSLTIFYVLTGIVKETGLRCDGGFDIPHDPDDFGRCYRLLERFPHWRNRMTLVSKAFPKWGPLVEVWGELEDLYKKEVDSGRCHALYERMSQLKDDCMAADGWVKTGPGGWRRPPQ